MSLGKRRVRQDSQANVHEDPDMAAVDALRGGLLH